MTFCGTGARLLTIAVAMLALMLPHGPLAMAHNELLGTDPSDGAQLATTPVRVILTFDLPAQHGFSTVVVTGPDGHQWQAGPATEQGTVVMAPIRPLGPAGKYTVAWRIVSADGHPVHGTFQFTLTTPGVGTAPAPPLDTGRATPATGTRSGGAAVWPWLAGVGALLVAGVVLALRASRTRRS
jgi:methionine-rich copper-binding protein CopC